MLIYTVKDGALIAVFSGIIDDRSLGEYRSIVNLIARGEVNKVVMEFRDGTRLTAALAWVYAKIMVSSIMASINYNVSMETPKLQIIIDVLNLAIAPVISEANSKAFMNEFAK